MLTALLVVAALISFATPYFLTVDNLMGVFRSFSLIAIMAIGMVMVIITGGIDLSVGSVMGLSSLATALGFANGLPMAACVAGGLAVGVAFGLFNGLLVTAVRLPPFIATLGSLSIGRGLMYIITHGVPVTPDTPDAFALIGQGYVGPVPVPVVIMAAMAVFFAVLMRRTRFGRHVYATGGNEHAARLSGVRTGRVKLLVYVLSGGIAAVAGVVGFSRYLSAEPGLGLRGGAGRDRGGGHRRRQPGRRHRQRGGGGDRRRACRHHRQRRGADEHQHLRPAGDHRRRDPAGRQPRHLAQPAPRRVRRQRRPTITLQGTPRMKLARYTLKAAFLALPLLAAAASAKDAKDITIAVVPKVAVPFFDDCNTGAQKAAQAAGVQYQWVVPQNTQGSTQVKIIEDLISKHVDGIAISVNEPKSVEGIIKKATDGGIKVLTFDSDSAHSARSLYIGTNNEAAGATMGEAMAKALDGKGEVAIVTGQLGASNLNERIAGIKGALAKHPGITVVATEGTEDDLARAVSVDEALLRGHPHLAGIFGVSQVGGPSVAKVMATKEFGAKKGTVKVFAFDDLPDTVKGVKEGFIQGIMVQRPVTMGKLAVETLVAQIGGKGAAPADIDTGVTVVDASNLGSYTK